jgi:hypothetical protein
VKGAAAVRDDDLGDLPPMPLGEALVLVVIALLIVFGARWAAGHGDASKCAAATARGSSSSSLYCPGPAGPVAR